MPAPNPEASRAFSWSASARVDTGPTRTRLSVPLSVRTGWTMALKPAARSRSRNALASAVQANAPICTAKPTPDAAGAGAPGSALAAAGAAAAGAAGFGAGFGAGVAAAGRGVGASAGRLSVRVAAGDAAARDDGERGLLPSDLAPWLRRLANPMRR